ncbi:MAG: acetyl-CoA carboxylase biotin carboxyl carrier protein subunit [Bacteroidetes bacterium]|nr:MAG: acetyl-CoA carboxylase biotin carboxyl carrier protein subunit [Bacteroidota bacterium]
MARIEANKSFFDITKNEEDILLNGDKQNYDIIGLPNGDFHLVLDNKSYTIKVLHKNTGSGTLALSINGRVIDTLLQNKLTDLLKSMGMESGKKKLKELKAPMPGLVLDILVQAGDEVADGDNLLVLEAMKMENAIKSPQAGIIEAISVKKQDKVEKNQILISFV